MEEEWHVPNKKAVGKKSVKKSARGTAKRSVARARTQAPLQGEISATIPPRERLIGLVEGLGNNRVAEFLEASPSQPSQWRSGKEGISPENERRVVDLDYVMTRLLQLFPKEQASIWLTSYNAHLGATPVDVLRLRGAGPVVQAIDAEAQGAYA